MSNQRSVLTIAATLLLFTISCSTPHPDESESGPGPSYRELMLKNYDDMSNIVKKHIQTAHKIVEESDKNSDWAHDAKLELLAAERVIFSRPDSDNMVAKLTPDVRREISAFSSYDDLLSDLTHEALQAFTSDQELPVHVQATYLFVLDNLMAEVRPDIAENTTERALVMEIRDANLKIPKAVIAQRRLISMYLTENPSAEAEKVLEAAGFGKKSKHK